jgi:hypothetical protein
VLLLCSGSFDGSPLKEAFNGSDTAPLRVGRAKGRQACNAFRPRVDRFASATGVLAPMRDQPPTQQIERALARFVVMTDDVKLLTRSNVVRRGPYPAVGHRQAINESVAQGLRSLDDATTHACDIWSDMSAPKAWAKHSSWPNIQKCRRGSGVSTFGSGGGITSFS